MPWSIHERDGKFCVVKDTDGSTVACHETRAKALAQQRALYANEPAVNASLELDTNALFEEFVTEIAPQQRIEIAPPPVRIEVDHVSEDLLKAMTAAMESISERLERTEERQERIVAALERLSEDGKQEKEALVASITEAVLRLPALPEPVVNVSPPQVHVTVEAPEIRKKVIVERDPLTGLIASAEILAEDLDDQL